MSSNPPPAKALTAEEPEVRGLVSLAVVVCVGFLALLFAYLDWWPDVLRWFGHQTVYMDMGFYLFLSSGLLLTWLLVVGLFDHLSFWRIRAGEFQRLIATKPAVAQQA
jgi:hypothetical protein